MNRYQSLAHLLALGDLGERHTEQSGHRSITTHVLTERIDQGDGNLGGLVRLITTSHHGRRPPYGRTADTYTAHAGTYRQTTRITYGTHYSPITTHADGQFREDMVLTAPAARFSAAKLADLHEMALRADAQATLPTA